MRTGCKVGGMEVVAFRPEKFGNDLRHSPHAITAALKSTKQGKSGEVKNFLDPSRQDGTIIHGVNSVRMRCSTVNICTLSSEIQQQLWEGKCI